MMIDVFLFSLNAVLPLILLVVIGYVIMRLQVVDDVFISKANRFCFTVAFPFNLFNSIVKIDLVREVNWLLIVFVAAVVLLLFAILMLAVPRFILDNRQRGALIQGIYRGNFLLLGYPLARNLFGEEGVGPTAMLLPVVIILYNVLATFVLEYYDDRTVKANLGKVILSCLKNPLIIGAALGVVFALLPWDLPLFLSRTVEDVGKIANPLALILLGGQFNWQKAAGNTRLLLSAVLVRMALVPLIVITLGVVIGFRGAELGAVYILFCAPTAVSSYIMAKNMNSDSDLAGQIILVTTILSGFTLFFGAFILRSLQLI